MNILVIKHGSLGDLVLSFGAIKTLRENYPNSNIYLLTQSNYKQIFKNLPYVNEILVDNRISIFPSVKNILKKVKEKKIDLLIDLQNSTRTEIYNLFIKIFTKCKSYLQENFQITNISKKNLVFNTSLKIIKNN